MEVTVPGLSLGQVILWFSIWPNALTITIRRPWSTSPRNMKTCGQSHPSWVQTGIVTSQPPPPSPDSQMHEQITDFYFGHWVLGQFVYSAILYWYLLFKTCIRFKCMFFRLPNQNTEFVFHFSLYKRTLKETCYPCKVGDHFLQNAMYITLTVLL